MSDAGENVGGVPSSRVVSGSMRGEGTPPTPAKVDPKQWRQLAWITVAALAIFLGMRLLPTGTNLSHMDFRMDPKAGTAIEFCDPLNPQFIPVVAVRSPVQMTVRTEQPPVAGAPVRGVVTLRTASGKAIGPEDLQYVHTQRLHLLIVDSALSDYQHVHPEPTRATGEWRFAFTPRAGGVYRVFADFTPAATGRGLYASADLNVAGSPNTSTDRGPQEVWDSLEREGVAFSLEPDARPVRAGRPTDWTLTIARRDGGALQLQPVMDALAHLVAFDEARSGFAHLHPVASDIVPSNSASSTTLRFKLTIPKPGRYIVWAQMNLDGRETFVPFRGRYIVWAQMNLDGRETFVPFRFDVR